MFQHKTLDQPWNGQRVHRCLQCLPVSVSAGTDIGEDGPSTQGHQLAWRWKIIKRQELVDICIYWAYQMVTALDAADNRVFFCYWDSSNFLLDMRFCKNDFKKPLISSAFSGFNKSTLNTFRFMHSFRSYGINMFQILC